MRANRRRDTKPEKAVRSGLHAQGLRFRVDYPVPGSGPRLVRPDIAFTRLKIAVFIDGCFWHGCPDHGRRDTGRNREYWSPKIARNQQRDREQAERLERIGWTVLRFWEHENSDVVVDHIVAAVRTRARELGNGPRAR